MKTTTLDISTVPLAQANLIEASAGTGKTYAIAALYLRLILEQGLTVQQILVVTYTKAATAELRERIRTRLRDTLRHMQDGTTDLNDPFLQDLLGRVRAAGKEAGALHGLTLALQDFDEAAVFTIHGFCQRVLMENAFESRETFDAEIITDQSGLVAAITEDYWRMHCSVISPFFAEYLLKEKKKFSLSILKSLALTVMNHQGVEVEPQGSAVDVSILEHEFRQKFQEARHQWEQGKEEVREILFNHASLNRKSYNLKSAVPGVYRDLGDLFVGGEPHLVLPKKFELVTQTYVRSDKGCKKKCIPPEHPFFETCDGLYQLAQDILSAFQNRIVLLKAGFAGYLTAQLRDRKQEDNVYGYDDMLLRVRNVLRDPANTLQAAVRSTYTAALIDEFQDTDPVQYDIFSTIFTTPSHILFLIGDPKQAIYGFRGADIFTYMQAAKGVDCVYTMNTNWRSEHRLLEAVNHLFKRITNPFVFQDIGFEPVLPAPRKMSGLQVAEGAMAFLNEEFKGHPDLAQACLNAATAPLHLWFLDKETIVPGSKKDISKDTVARLLADAVAAEASRLIRMGRQGIVSLGEDNTPLQPRHLAVLVRTNREAGMVQNAMQRCGLPSVIAGSGNIFLTEQALEMQRIMEGVAERGVPSRVKSALATRMLGFDAAHVDALDRDEEEWDRILVDFAASRDVWISQGFMGFFSSLMTGWSVRPRLLGLEGGERKLTNVLHLMEILHGAEKEHDLNMSGLLTWFAEQCSRDDSTAEEHQLRLESDELAVQIVTIHKSKGLQYPVVFCPFLFEGVKDSSDVLIHDPDTHTSVLDVQIPADEERKLLAYREILAENMRLAYVALTRAESRCYLACGKVNQAEFSAMAYLFSGYEPDGDVSLPALAEVWQKVSNEDVYAQLQEVKNKVSGCAVYPMPGLPGNPVDLLDIDRSERLTLPVFSRTIEQRTGISSFSSLVRGREHTARPGFDEPFVPALPADSEGGSSFFDFPKGAGPWTMLHDVLEHLDFATVGSQESLELIREKLQRYGMDEKWVPTLSGAMQEVVGVDLGEGFSLSQVHETLPELEFYYPLQGVTSRELSALYARWGETLPDVFTPRMEGLRFKPRQGFMLGFIDLVFRHEGKWYLVDWKSNYLGDSFAQYKQPGLTRAMAEHMYFFQSHIYTVALDGYLQMRVPDYRYDRDFGGILYVFLRGVDADLGPEYGIYREKPDPGFIGELSDYLIG